MTDNGTSRNGGGRAPAGLPERIELPRGQAVVIGTGAFVVSTLPGWIALLRRWYGWSVRPCLTHSATALVAPAALAAAAGTAVWGPDWPTAGGVVPHRELAEWADVVIVAPATGNFVAKCARGIADSLALSVVTSTPAPVFIAPAFSGVAADRPSSARNLALLAEEGYHVIPTQNGVSVHTGRTEPGRMADLGKVLVRVGEVLNPPATVPAPHPPPADAPTTRGDAVSTKGSRV